MGFEKWASIHTEADQVKRLESAKSAKCTPVSIDAATCSGVFSGSHGVYHTNLDECRCVDFARRKKPCKHMYRLAAELGVFGVDGVVSDSSKIQAPAPKPSERKAALAEVVEMIESYDISVQDGIREVLYMAYKKEQCFCADINLFNEPIKDGLLSVQQDYYRILRENTQKNTLGKLEGLDFKFPDGLKTTKKARFEWCLEHADEVGALVYPNAAFLSPAGLLEIAQRKVYTYLLRKLTDDQIFTGSGQVKTYPHGAEFFIDPESLCVVSVSFPDDDVTALLDKYGANRCKEWKP